MNAIAANVCVIGGGPAGSVFAARMAMLGHTVCLVERDTFPRPRIGESLTPGVLTLLDSIGLRQSIQDAGFPSPPSVIVDWDQGPQERTDPGARGLLVDRGRFDALLLARAIALGVQVLQPAAVRSCQENARGWLISARTQPEHPQTGQTVEIHADFLADASGRSFATRGRKRRTSPATTALYAYWKGAVLPDRPRIKAAREAWFWGVPLPNGLYNTIVFVDPRSCAPRHFREWIAHSGLLDGGRDLFLASPVMAIDATPYRDEEGVTATSIKVGDAALTIDPLSSSGVQKAIQTSLAGAITVNTLLRKPDRGTDAINFYRSTLQEASEQHCRWAGQYYAKASAIHRGPFWDKRASRTPTVEPPPALSVADFADTRWMVSPEVRFLDTPCVDDAFVSVRTACHHPALDRPVAYLGGFELSPLLQQLPPRGLRPVEIGRLWSHRLSLETSLAVTGWLASRGILVRTNQ